MALLAQNIKQATAPMEGCNLAVLESVLDQIDSGKLDFYERAPEFKLTIALDKFNLLSVDFALYNKINLPFEVTIYNNTFMKTRVFRLVSRKIPNTVNWFSNIQVPFDVEIGESRSFIIYVCIDSFDDVDWLIDNDLAFMMYSDNTTLSEIDFAIRVPDIRGVLSMNSMGDTTLDLDDWYNNGLLDLEDIVPRAFKLDDDAKMYSKLKDFQVMADLSPDLTYGKEALEAMLIDIWDNNKLQDLETRGMPADMKYNIMNLRQSRGFRDKFKFNIIRFAYYEGITEQNLDVGWDEARTIFNAWKSENQQKININNVTTDVTTQKNNLDGLAFMVRIPFFGSQYIVYDLVFYVINIRNTLVRISEISDLGAFVGGFIRLHEAFSEEPSIQGMTLQYDISSQVKENLTTLQSFEARNYVKEPDSTDALGYKIVGVDVSVLMPTLIAAEDITLSYYHNNPILAYKKNWIVYEHSADFRDNIVGYDWTTYFGIDATDPFPDNSINIYSVDYTIQKQIQNVDTLDWTETETDWTISNTVSISVSNEVKNSFKIISTKNLADGASTLLLSDITKDLDMVVIDTIEIFNNGNTFLNITDLNMFQPNGKYEYSSKQEDQYGTDVIKQSQITNDTEFYKSIFDRETPAEVMAFNSLAPGESGDIYIIYRLNRNLVHAYFAEFFKIPVYLRLEFNDNMSAFFCPMATHEFSSIASYNNYVFDSGVRGKVGYQYPYYHQMFNQYEGPGDIWPAYAEINSSVEDYTIFWKNKFHHDVAFFSDAIVKSNILDNTQIDVGNDEPLTSGPFVDGKMTAFSWCFIIPTPDNLSNISTINDLVSLYRVTSPNDIDYRFYFMKFDTFFDQLIEDVKSKYHLISLISHEEDKIVYFRHNERNQYQWFDCEVDDVTHAIQPIELSWLSQFNAKLTINIPETDKNVFDFVIPKPLEFVNLYAVSQDSFGSILGGVAEEDISDILAGKVMSAADLKAKSGESQRQYFPDRFHTVMDFGEIVGNKFMTLAVECKWFNLFRIKSFDNIEISNQSIGPGLPDVYSMRILQPDLTYANIIFEFFKYDYTLDMVWEQKVEESITQNAGNYLITPPYFDLQYIPIDETYSVMVKVKNQNPWSVQLSMLPMDFETNNAIQLISFPEHEDYNKVYLHLKTLNKPYTLLPNEEVKMFFNVIPRRIGMSFYTVYLKLNNTIRPINFEFRSFINRKAYFVLDQESKVVDFGDVPIGKFVEEPIIVKNLGSVVGKINSIYTFGNDAKQFKLLDRNNGNELAERITYNKVVAPKTSLSIPIRFFSQSYGFNYSYCYIETNEPVLEDAQWYEGDETGTDFTQLYRNAPKYLVSLLKANSVIEDEAIETDSYIFLGYVNPLKSRFRNYEVAVRNKNRNKIISIFKVTNLMKNYVKVKYTREPFQKESSIFIQLNPRGYTEGWYYDELFVWMIVYDKNTKQSKYILNKIPVSWYVTREQRLSFDVDLEEIIFSTKPFIKSYKKVHVKNYSNEDATMFLNLLNDHSGLFTMVPDLNNQNYVIPEGVNFTFMVVFGGDQRFIGKYDTMLTVQFELGEEQITKYVPVTGIVGDENIIKFYRRSQIRIGT